ncbi:MAG: RcpC/CpaB family pilus assembly protein [Acidimicrobiales bacterium]|nr:hypothetical protein [Acidimicrobiales bacterium]
MSQRRTLILIAAIVVGALASFLVWNYTQGVRDQAYSDAERVKVYLVDKEIPRGTAGNIAVQSISEEQIPRKFKPANAIESLDDIAGQVAKSDLVPNQVVVADMFVAAGDPDAIASNADKVTEIKNKDMSTFTITASSDNAVAGLIAPGDYVNILVKSYAESLAGGVGEATDTDGASGVSSGADPQARYVYQKAQVLFVGTTSVEQANSATSADGTEAAPVAGSTQITLILPVEATQLLASIPAENIYFSLVAKDYEPKATDKLDTTTPPSENPQILTPYGPEGARTKD